MPDDFTTEYNPKPNWHEVRVVYDKHCPVDTAYLLNHNFLVTAVRMSKRTWWKPWTWRRHVLSIEEMWNGR